MDSTSNRSESARSSTPSAAEPAPSFYWFDYETFGTHPAWDRPCQFAGVRTDMELNEIDEPMVIYCRQSMDYLPNPIACKVTGLTPQHVNTEGLSENVFIQRIVEQIGRPETCSLGYNSIRFDDEFTRHTLFRNFFDPYEHEYRNGSSRWDLLDIVRLTRALRPDGISWPVNEDGSPSNRLEHLSEKNGIEHGHAHDALSDVRATIDMARLIRRVQPRLFDYAYQHRSKQSVAQQLSTSNAQISLLISGTIPSHRSHIAAILPLVTLPDNRNSVIVLDLEQDPSELLNMDSEDIAQRVFSRPANDCNEPTPYRPGLRTVQINKYPVVVPLKTMRPNDAERLGIDLQRIEKHADLARRLHDPDRQQKIISAMTRTWPETSTDVEGSLYSGSFLSQSDKQRATQLRQSGSVSLNDISGHFEDRRLIELAWRYQARNYPDSLDAEQRLNWKEHCRTKLNDASAPWLTFEQFDREIAATSWSENESALKQALIDYRDHVYHHTEFTEQS
ncbi:MAG: exodeoxyribonuclease I [Granulosicoccus sp.]